MKFLTISIAILSALTKIYSQDNFQQIRGTITDKESLSILRGATVLLSNSNDSIRISDNRGQYKFSNVKPGRYEIKVFYNGYAEVNIPNIEVTSGRESIIDISLVEKVRQLKRVKISGQKKSGTINELATNSARTFSMEEVNRYAGGRSDAARLASNFAGVSTPDDSRNDIVIRGNSPTGVLWRLEGMNIPNPNHFATVGTTGGPVSALNTNMLKNSDFFTSAFPAEYGNANAGVFDINLRKGNTEKYEHMFQLGALTGLEAVSEGPFRKGSGASYVVAYRYSFAGIAQSIGIPIGTTATPFYTDLTFKINTAESKLGKFTVFGLAGYSNIEFLHNKIDSTDLFANPNADSYFKSLIGVLGIKHAIKINDKSYWNTVIGGSIANSEFDQDSLDKPNNRSGRVIENIGKRNVYNINTNFNSKVNSQLFVKIGAQADLMTLDLFFRDRNKKTDWVQYWDFKDATVLTQHYAQAKYSFTDKIIANLGIHSQYLTLNNSFAIEPRLGLKYIATP
ncbi:MAG: carboxypeptidase regulatory-like domain-containing protein, partial [Chitinophagales bacterium]